MSEDRTQAPSVRRRQAARERGQVAHSPELTGAAGLLGAAAALAQKGGDLAAALRDALAEPLTAAAVPLSADAGEVVGRLRHLAAAVGGPILVVGGAAALAALAAHQAQVRGLWAPGLLAPDPARLWPSGQGGGLVDRAGRGLWALAKAAAVVGVAAWAVRSGWEEFPRLAALDAPGLALASGRALGRLLLALAGATLVLGVVDFGLRFQRYEALLRMSPDEHREDLRSVEGDPALRARRRRLARAWRADPAELLAGASLVLTGPSGLTVVLAGGPPPRPVMVRAALTGAAGERLRQAVEGAKGGRGVPLSEAPDLSLRLSRRRPPGRALEPGLLAEVATLWPGPGRTSD